MSRPSAPPTLDSGPTPAPPRAPHPPAARAVLPAWLRAMRPQQWVKNVFVLAAVVFARADRNAPKPEGWDDVVRSLYAFAAFCLGASAIYLINDLLDVQADRSHPVKRLRPIAAGELSVRGALGVAAACLAGALWLGFAADGDPLPVAWLVGGYLVLNFAYTAKLKHVVILDVFCIAAGFLLRVKAGGLAAHYYVSYWLMLCTLFLALFLALCKRRSEIDLLGDERGSHRSNLLQYTPGFLDQMTTMLAAVTVVCYTMYTVDESTTSKFGEANRLVYSVPFVVFGLARYMLLVQTQKGGGSPTRVLLGGDPIFLANTVLWALVAGAAAYGLI